MVDMATSFPFVFSTGERVIEAFIIVPSFLSLNVCNSEFFLPEQFFQ